MIRRHVNKPRLKIMSVNIRSFRGKKAVLEHLIEDKDPHVVCIQESRMKKEIKLRGYTEKTHTLPGDRNSGNRGTKLLMRSDVTVTVRDITRFHLDGCEITAINIHLPGEPPITVINTYISPSINNKPRYIQEETIQNMVNLTNSFNRAIAVGDFNSKTDIPQHIDTNPLGDLLDKKLENLEISASIPNTYTRYDPGGRAPSTLDMALTSIQNSQMIERIDVLDDVGSDHRPIMLHIPIGKKIEVPMTIEKPNFTKANWGTFQDVVTQKMNDAPEISPNKDSIDGATKFLSETIQTADKSAIPRIVIRTGKKKRQLPRFIVDKIKQKHRLRNRIQNHNEYFLKPEVNRLDTEIREQIEEYELIKSREQWNNARDKTPHGFYPIARRILKGGSSSTTFPIKDKKGKILTQDTDKVKEFQELYESIYSSPPATEASAQTQAEVDTYYIYLESKYKEVQERELVRDMNTTVTGFKIREVLANTRNTAPGEDGIFYLHLRNLPDCAMNYLAKIYSTAWKTCYFPDPWKDATVILLPKPNKDHSSTKSYRPITMLPAIGKTFERVINSEFSPHLENTNKLPETQAGFRKKRSTQDQLLKIVQDATTAMNLGQTLIATMFDIEKAFDKMWIQATIFKMYQLGIEEQTVALMMSYLKDRTIRLKINKAYSERIKLKAGTPQGAILSPTIFGIWVGDIPKPPKGTSLSQFADDIATWSKGRNEITTRDNLQTYNDSLVKWCKKWRITLSPAKSQLITISKKDVQNVNAIYQRIDGHLIKPTETVEFLGVILDKRLNLRSQHERTMKELKRRRKLFGGITGSVLNPKANTEICLQILKSMIIPVTSYAPTVTCTKTDAMFAEQDKEIRMSARLAIHAPFNTRSAYVQREADLEPSKDVTCRIGKTYVTSDERSISVKKYIQDFRKRNIRPWKTRTPLTVLLQQ